MFEIKVGKYEEALELTDRGKRDTFSSALRLLFEDEHPAIEVAAYEVAQDFADVDDEDISL